MVRRSRSTLPRLPGREAATDHVATTAMARAADTAADAGEASVEDAAADTGNYYRFRYLVDGGVAWQKTHTN